MKATIVPAQVTTVEDRVAGNLGFSQLILLAIPVFGGSLLYAILPPTMGISLYKILIVTSFALICGVLSIRIKGKIILLWFVLIMRYRLRPRRYLFNKNSVVFRQDYPEPTTRGQLAPHQTTKRKLARLPKLGILETSGVYAAIDNPANQLRFETTKKGGLNVHLTQVKEYIK